MSEVTIMITAEPRKRDVEHPGPGWHWQVIYKNQIVKGDGECNSENDAAHQACAAYKRLHDLEHNARQVQNAKAARAA